MSTAVRTKPTRANWVRRIVAGTLLVVFAVIGGTAFRVWQVAREDVRDRADVIVVLGAAQYNGRPSEIFQSRLAKAKALYDQGVAATIVTAGGKKADDNYTEAQAGALWLRKRGVPVSATLAVGEGSDTLRSLRAVAEQVEKRGWKTAVLVSDPWHSFRARTMADDLGLDAWTSPTHSGPIVQTRETQAFYIVRETGALLYYRLTKSPVDAL
ncbi:YdcF family protein [Amycolatopsis pittospori]|uniref:YdcF family protein n=1 Tax=Amycolatopsis pittospori TaxID=2749434 RepID=UPI0015F0D1D0|nr:YdcF family protein [Amycolatopsis pittospori]